MINLILRKRNGTKVAISLDKSAVKEFRTSWQQAHRGIGTVLVVYSTTGTEIAKINVHDIQHNYYEMIQVKE